MDRNTTNSFGSEFMRCERGGVSLFFALSALPLITVSGAALDYARAASFKAELQSAVDATAIALAATSSDNHALADESHLVSYDLRVDSVEINVENGRVYVVVEHSIPTIFMSIVGFDSISIRAVAEAERFSGGNELCLLALNETAPKALTFNGSASFLGPECAVHSNSAAPDGLHVGGNASAIAAGFCSRGGFSVPSDFDQSIRGNCGLVHDPFAEAIHPPDASGCDHVNFSVNPNQHTEIRSGIYCGGLSIRGSAEFAHGAEIVIKEGDFRINAQASVTGDGVFFYLTGNGSGLSFNGGADIDLSAPTGGEFGGILVYQDPDSSPGTQNHLNGGATARFNGVFYTPGHEFRLNGSAGFGQDSDYMPIIADKITITGNSDMKIDRSDVDMIANIPTQPLGARLTQ